ncbi:MAG: glycoside hydrolase family 3 protein [Eubacteriales bacterium]|nr:glycoside hydrolase family 3 protein [Eubacteriales bacterium]
MSDRESRRADRRRRRRRNQIISYCVMAIVAAAVAAGCVIGVRAAAGAVREKQSSREAALREVAESSRAAESALAESVVAAMFEETGTEEETSSAYTREDALSDMVEDTIAGMTLEQKVAGLFFVTPEQLTGVGQVIQAGDGTREALAKYPVGGIIYFAKNIQSADQLTQMLSNTVSYSPFPLFLGVDEEGGKVARVADALQLDNTGAAAQLGSAEKAQSAYETIGGYLSSYGFNVDFAPVADVLTNPDNTVIGDRAFSSDAQTASELVASAVQGLQGKGVSACLKHFPGHGDTAGDSHTGAAETDRTKEEMESAEFLPFRAGIEAGADMVMVGHISAPALTGGDNIPASLSEDVITGILRNELGYNGIVVTDALDMAAVTDYYEADVAAVMALKAGADMVMMPENFEQAYQGVLDAVQNGTVSIERVEDSLRRLYRVKLRGRLEE